MKRRIVSIVSLALVVLLVGLTGGCGVPKSEVDELVAELEKDCQDQLANQKTQLEESYQNQLANQKTQLEKDCQDQLADQKTQLEESYQNQLKEELENQLAESVTESAEEKAELLEEMAALEAQIEDLRKPTPKMSGEIVGTITFDELKRLADKFFSSWSVSSYTKGPYPLTDLETLKEFLEQDSTNISPYGRENIMNAIDERAFRLKDRWIKAKLPPHSLGLIKRKRMTTQGEVLGWYNIFITEEAGEYVIYEVVPSFDKVGEKIEEPISEYAYAVIHDRM